MMALMGQAAGKLEGPSAVLRAEALRILRAREHELRAKGVAGLALFGSTARGEAGPASDVDLVLDLEESAALGLLDLVDLKETLAEQLGRPVDIAFRSRL